MARGRQNQAISQEKVSNNPYIADTLGKMCPLSIGVSLAC